MSSPSDADQNLRRLITVLAVVVGVLLVVALWRDGAGSDAGSAAKSTATTTSVSTTTSTTWRQATDLQPLKILVVGDSLVGWIPTALEDATTERPVEVIDAWKGSSGLARPDFYDWPAEVGRLVDEHDPDVVVVGFGGNDAQSLVTDGTVIQRGDPAWQVEYQRRVGQVLDAAEGTGRSLWWIGLPLSQVSNIEAVRPTINDAVNSQLETRPWAHYVDSTTVLAPDGTYRVSLPRPDGSEVRVRADDGIHLSPDGGRMVVGSFLDDVKAERGF